MPTPKIRARSMINKVPGGSILVNVRQVGTGYSASIGEGKARKTSTSTSSAGFAARTAAEKFLGCKLDDCVVIEGRDFHSGTKYSCYAYAARLVESVQRPRGAASEGVLLVKLARTGQGRYFMASCGEQAAVDESAKAAVMTCAVRAWAAKKKETVQERQISAKEIQPGIFETRCYRGEVPAIELVAGPLTKRSVGGRHAR